MTYLVFRPCLRFITITGFVLWCFSSARAQTIDPSAYSILQYRMIEPHRGGCTVGATGVVQQPNVFYIGVNNGSIWKATDYDRTWNPVFDKQSTGSIGDIEVAPSNPDVIYAGSGEGLQRPDLSVGDGVYKSTDAGKTWVNTGLKNAQQIMQRSDMPVTTQVVRALNQADNSLSQLIVKFDAFTGGWLKTLNQELSEAGMAQITL
jgi:hypothetical protein